MTDLHRKSMQPKYPVKIKQEDHGKQGNNRFEIPHIRYDSHIVEWNYRDNTGLKDMQRADMKTIRTIEEVAASRNCIHQNMI